MVRVGEAVFAELRLDHRQRQRRAVNGAAHQRRDMRHTADVILVAVRQDQRARAAFLLQIAQIRDDAVHSQQVGIREHDARIDDHRRLAPGERQHVHPELAEAAERHDFEHSPYVETAPPCRCGPGLDRTGQVCRADAAHQAAGRA